MSTPSPSTPAVTYQFDDRSSRILVKESVWLTVRRWSTTIIPVFLFSTIVLIALGQYKAVAISWLLFVLFAAWAFMPTLWRKPSIASRQVTNEINDDGILSTSSNGWGLLGWTSIDGATLKSDHIFVASHGLLRITCIPTSVFESPTVAEQFAQTIDHNSSQPRKSIRLPHLSETEPLCAVNYPPAESNRFQTLILPCMIAMMIFVINLEVSKLDSEGMGSTVFGVIFFYVSAYAIYHAMPWLPVQPRVIKKQKQITAENRTVSLLETGVHINQQSEESFTAWSVVTGAMHQAGDIQLTSSTGPLVKIPESAFKNLQAIDTFLSVARQHIDQSPEGRLNSDPAREADANPYSPPKTESATDATALDKGRVVAYELTEQEVLAGINTQASTLGILVGAAAFFAAASAPLLFPALQQAVPVSQRSMLEAGAAVLGFAAGIAMFFPAKNLVARKTHDKLLATPLFAPGPKRIACDGKTLWFEAGEESYQFRYPGTQQHGRITNRIVLSSESVLCVIPRSAVAADDYDHLVKSIRQIGLKLK